MDGQDGWAIKNVVLDVGEPMDALCTNKTFDLLTVAGKSVMKVFAIRNNQFEQVLDLRSKTSNKRMYFSGSVSWNAVNENLIAATSSTGMIVLFDLDKCQGSAFTSQPCKFIDQEGPAASDQLFRANKPAATKVCFHSYNPFLFVSGSKDALYLHDYRLLDQPATSFAVRGSYTDPIRDLQFCLDLQHQDHFITGGDSGLVRFWDLRKPDRYLKEFIGNTNSVGVALNPNLDHMNLLATVGRDSFIQIWDWTFEKPKVLHTIETSTTIGRVEWDPISSYIATTTNLHDHQLLIWSYERPFFPIMTFRGHSSNISDMAFPQHSEERKFVTCGKDRKLILHFMEQGDETMDNVAPISMATGPHNELITSFPEAYLDNNTIAELDYSKPVKSTLMQYSNDFLPNFNDSDNLIKLAKALAYTWKVLGILIQQADIYKPPPSNIPKDAYFEYIDPNKPRREQKEKCEEEGELSESDSELNFESGAFCQNFKETISLEADLFFNVDEFKMPGLLGGSKFLEFIQQKHESLMNSDLDLINEEAVIMNPENLDEDSDTAGSDLDANSNGSDQNLSSNEDSSSSRRSNSPQLLSSCESTMLESESLGSPSSERENWVDEENGPDNWIKRVGINGGSENWGPLSILKRLINAYSDINDSQTCATICLILDKLASQMFGDDQVSAWFFHYIEMLQDAGCNELATFMAKQCACEEVSRVIQENMHVKFFCANCSTAAPSGMTSCQKCGTSFATVCTVCDHEVKGLFSQCNECGHGGHYEHLEVWFKKFGICAFPGCEHVCVKADKELIGSAEKSPESYQTSNDSNNKLLACGQNLFSDTEDLSYYRDENGLIQKLPEVFVESKKQKTHKYSLDP